MMVFRLLPRTRRTGAVLISYEASDGTARVLRRIFARETWTILNFGHKATNTEETAKTPRRQDAKTPRRQDAKTPRRQDAKKRGRDETTKAPRAPRLIGNE